MQRIERYGVIALVFLLVTILAVSLWGDGKGELMASKDEDPAGHSSTDPAADLPIARTSPLQSRGARDRALPTSDNAGADDAVPRDRNHSRNPNVLDPDPSSEQQPELDQERRGRRSLPTPETTPDVSEQAPPRPVFVAQVPSTDLALLAAPAPTRPNRSLEIATARTCVVGPGETLSQIAQRELGTSKRWPEIAELNGGLAPEELQQGMVLKLPLRDTAQAAQLVAAATSPAATPKTVLAVAAAPSGARTYRVKQGDILGLIAQRELGSSKRWKEIAQLNPKVDPERLIVGASLLLPGSAPAPRSPAAANLQVAKVEPAALQSGWSPDRSGGKVR